MSSRWGEEEKKTKGIMGCLVAVFILAGFSYTFYANYESIDGRRQLEKKMQDIVRSGYEKDEDEMVSEILDAASALKVQLQPEQVTLSKTLDKYNNPVVDVRIDYTFTVNLFVTQFPVSIPIHEEVTIVFF